MKSNEFHKLVRKAGWEPIRQVGSHIIYKKDGKSVSVPSHGSKEIPIGTEKALRKQLGL